MAVAMPIVAARVVMNATRQHLLQNAVMPRFIFPSKNIDSPCFLQDSSYSTLKYPLNLPIQTMSNIDPDPNPRTPQHQSQPVITILDGGFSRELISLSAPFAQPEWSALSLLSGPSSHKLIRQAHDNFIAAGADIITTNSYAVVPFHIGEDRFWSQGKEVAGLAGRLAREAVDEANAGRGREGMVQNGVKGKVKVAASLPPIFGSYEPALFNESTVQKYLNVLVAALSPHADLWLAETLSLIAEAEAVVQAVKHASASRTGGESTTTRKPIWISFTLADAPEDAMPQLRSGEPVAAAAAAVAGWDEVDALLFNCSRPEVMLDAVTVAKRRFSELGCKKLIGVYANRFEARSKTEQEEYRANEGISALREELGVQEYVELARRWVNAGADVVGGCCGIGSEYIRRLDEEFRGAGEGEAVGTR